MDNRDIQEQLAALSPAKRALFELHLKQLKGSSLLAHSVPRRATREAAPLSFAQQQLWILHQLEPESPAYNESCGWHLRGRLDVAALQNALSAVVARHEIFHTVITSIDGNPLQTVVAPHTVEIPLIDLRAGTAAGRDTEIHRLLGETIRRPFDLSRDLPLRVLLLRLADQEHIFFWVVHHIAFDGWSGAIFRRDLSTFYRAFFAEQEPSLADLPIQYQDYAGWQRQWLQGELLEAQLTYWKKQLNNIATLQLPTDHPRPARQTFNGAHLSAAIPKELANRLKAFSNQENATLFMTLLAVFQVLLHRYTGQDDIAVGSPIAGRTRPEIENMIGFFVNTLVLRTQFTGPLHFREVLYQVRETALAAYAHQDVPFELLVQELQPQRDLSHSPLFQVLFNFRNIPEQAFELPELEICPINEESGVAKFDLSLAVIDHNGELAATIEYNTDLFRTETIERMLGHYHTLLQAVVATPDEPIATLPLLTSAEEHQLLVEWNSTKRDYSHDLCVHHLFEAQVECTPDAVAVVCEGQHLTYRELNTRANQLAHYLRRRGVGPEVLVGLCVERSIEMMVALLGILKAGGAYVPLDPAYPQERLTFMLQNAQVTVLVAQAQLLSKLPALKCPVICLDTDWSIITQESVAAPIAGATAENLVYMIYTSGSTGQPKGVQIPHRALSNVLHATGGQPGMSGHDTLLAVTTLSFDIAALELFLPLTVGARIVLASREAATDGRLLQQHLATSGATLMHATPSTWRMLIDTGWPGNPQLTMLCGGEALPQELARELLPRGAALWNLYGPTETTIWSTLSKVDTGERHPTLGRPLANTQLYLLDPHLQPVPIGVPGELYIGGDGLARGYLHRPELTIEKFIPHPFSLEPGARLYRTGDQARYLPDGNIEFLGRRDQQVKLRGFRIELGEIESVLRQQPAIRDTVVALREDAPRDKRLVAYLVSAPCPPPTVSELRSALQRKLPDYMIPSAFVFLDTLPLMPNGKLDRRALPPPESTRPVLEQAFVAPRTPEEEVIAGIWAQVLGLERVGIHDNFFALGGHSLKATQVVSRIQAALQIELSLRTLFEAPTVAGLASVLGSQPRRVLGRITRQPRGTAPR